MGLDVVELQERILRASPSAGGHIGALAGVAAPDSTLHLAWNIALTGGVSIRSRTDNRTGMWSRRCPELLLLDLLQKRQCPVEQCAGIAIGDLATEEYLEASKLIVRVLADGELHPVALWGRGLDDRTWPRNRQRG
jgi:hypothetical protein